MFVGLVTAWRLATVPTRRSPLCVKATTDGVVRPPSLFSMTVGSPPSSTAMHELVVPRSIPMVFAMWAPLCEYLSLLDADCSRSGTSAKARIRAHAGRRAWQVRRPWRSRFTWNSSSWPRRRDLEHRVVQLLERRALAEQPEPRPDARDVRVDGHVALAVGEQQHAGRGLAADAGQRGQLGAALLDARVREVVDARRIVELAQDRLDPERLDLRDAAGPDRQLDLGVRRVADLGPAAEALAQAEEGHVAVAVVGRLREDGEDQLVEALTVRRGVRAAVELTETVADAPDAGAAGRRHGAQTVSACREVRRPLPRSGEI